MALEETERVQMIQAVLAYRKMILAYANAIVRDFHLAEDIFQEVAIVVVKQWEHMPPPDQLLPWLREITRRKSLELLRKHRRMPMTLSQEVLEVVAGQLVAEPGGLEPEDDQEKKHQMLEDCMQKLQGVARTVISRRYGDAPSSCEEIAQSLGRSVHAVHMILCRARLALAHCVEQHEQATP